MKISTKDSVAHLSGHLTLSGITHNIITSLALSLQQLASLGKKQIRIDCRRIYSADTSGLQLLYVWMQCARLRGVEPELINLPGNLIQTIQRLGLGDCFTETILVG